MVNIEEIFTRIQARLEKIDPNDRKVLHVFKLIITDDDGGALKTWVLDLVQVKLYEGDDDAEVTLKLKQSTIVDIIEGRLDSTEALNKDMIEVEGNVELIQLLKPFLSSV